MIIAAIIKNATVSAITAINPSGIKMRFTITGNH